MLNKAGTTVAPPGPQHCDFITDYLSYHKTISGAVRQSTHRLGPCGTSLYPTSGLFKLSLPAVTKIMSVLSSLSKNQQLRRSLDEGDSVAPANTAMHVRVCGCFILIKKHFNLHVRGKKQRNS